MEIGDLLALVLGLIQHPLDSNRAAKTMSVNRALFSSRSDEWSTPQFIFDQLDREFHFQLDVCALPKNAKCNRYFSPKENGLLQKWTGTCWMNPPYGREIGDWMKKAYESSQQGAIVVCLVPARTDTRWWQDFAVKGEIRFIRGRIRFGNAKSPAPFPSAIVIFRQRWWEQAA